MRPAVGHEDGIASALDAREGHGVPGYGGRVHADANDKYMVDQYSFMIE